MTADEAKEILVDKDIPIQDLKDIRKLPKIWKAMGLVPGYRELKERISEKDTTLLEGINREEYKEEYLYVETLIQMFNRY